MLDLSMFVGCTNVGKTEYLLTQVTYGKGPDTKLDEIS